MNLSTLRQSIASKVSELDGFQESTHSPDYFGRTQNTVAHLGFTVGVSSSTAMDERQRRTVGVYLNTPVTVTFAHRLRPLDVYPIDYDNSLDKEVDVINKVLEVYTTDNQFTIRYLASTREVTDSQEYCIITLDFQALHTI
jgi:hypothetical protein